MTKPGTPTPEEAENIQSQADAALDEMTSKETDDLLEADVVAHEKDVLWSISYRTS
jgi:hypothetical protein